MNAACEFGVSFQVNSVELLVGEDLLALCCKFDGAFAPFGVGAHVFHCDVELLEFLCDFLEVREAAEGFLGVVEIGVDISAGLFDMGVLGEDRGDRVPCGGVEVGLVAELPGGLDHGRRSP